MISAFVASQILAGVAFVFGLSAYQCRTRKQTVTAFMCAQICNSTHLFLLGATAGALIMGLSALRFFTSIFTTHPAVKYTFIGVVLVVGAFVYEEIYDVLPVFASIFGTLAAFEEKDRRMRHYFMIGSLTILSYYIVVFSPVAIAAGCFYFTSALIGYWRFYIRKQPEFND